MGQLKKKKSLPYKSLGSQKKRREWNERYLKNNGQMVAKFGKRHEFID